MVGWLLALCGRMWQVKLGMFCGFPFQWFMVFIYAHCREHNRTESVLSLRYAFKQLKARVFAQTLFAHPWGGSAI